MTCVLNLSPKDSSGFSCDNVCSLTESWRPFIIPQREFVSVTIVVFGGLTSVAKLLFGKMNPLFTNSADVFLDRIPFCFLISTCIVFSIVCCNDTDRIGCKIIFQSQLRQNLKTQATRLHQHFFHLRELTAGGMRCDGKQAMWTPMFCFFVFCFYLRAHTHCLWVSAGGHVLPELFQY